MDREPITSQRYVELLNSFNNGHAGMRLMMEKMVHGDPLELDRFIKPYPIAYMFVALMMLRAGFDMDSVDAEIFAFINGQSLRSICRAVQGVSYNEVGGNDLHQIAQLAGFERKGELSGNDWNAQYGKSHDFGAYVTLDNVDAYFDEKVDVITAFKVFEIYSGIERRGGHLNGCVELLACIANALKDGGYLLVEDEMTGVSNELLGQMGFSVLLRDAHIDSLTSGRIMTLLQFSPTFVSESMLNAPLPIPYGRYVKWDSEEMKYLVSLTLGSDYPLI